MAGALVFVTALVSQLPIDSWVFAWWVDDARESCAVLADDSSVWSKLSTEQRRQVLRVRFDRGCPLSDDFGDLEQAMRVHDGALAARMFQRALEQSAGRERRAFLWESLAQAVAAERISVDDAVGALQRRVDDEVESSMRELRLLYLTPRHPQPGPAPTRTLLQRWEDAEVASRVAGYARSAQRRQLEKEAEDVESRVRATLRRPGRGPGAS